jgi:hypothetical protein
MLKSADFLIHQLVDIVSKNGNLLLNVGPRPDGTIPDEVRATLLEMGAWLEQNGEAIYATEPWKIYGEGPIQIQAGFGHDVDTKPYSTSDFRFTRRGDDVYVISLACPTDRTATIHSFGLAGEGSGLQIREVSLLGSADKVDWLRTTDALNVRLPLVAACKHGFAPRLRVANQHSPLIGSQRDAQHYRFRSEVEAPVCFVTVPDAKEFEVAVLISPLFHTQEVPMLIGIGGPEIHSAEESRHQKLVVFEPGHQCTSCRLHISHSRRDDRAPAPSNTRQDRYSAL